MFHDLNIIIHVSCGTIALIIGLIPYLTQKGGKAHRKYGRLFLLLMLVVITTAIIGLLFFRDRPFLTVVTMLSFYTAFGGYRALKYREQGPGWGELLVTLLAISCALWFLVGTSEGRVLWHSSVVNILLGYLLLWCIYDLLRFIGVIKRPGIWLPEHVLKMTSAYYALFSAATGTVLSAWEPWNQIIPAIVGTLLYVVILVYFFRRRNRKVSGQI